MDTSETEDRPPPLALVASGWIAAAAFGALGVFTFPILPPATLAAIVGVALLLVTRAWAAALAGALVGAGAAGLVFIDAWLSAQLVTDGVDPALARPAVVGFAAVLVLGACVTVAVALRFVRERGSRG